MSNEVTIIGAGLAGCEAAWQLAQQGVPVRLVERKRKQRTPAQVSDHLAELVCSNSLRSRNPLNAVGLLKEEMRRLKSLIIKSATLASVPAGDALAVDRERFAAAVEGALEQHPLITIDHEAVDQLPTSGPTIVSTGPLTGEALATDIQRVTGSERLYFYDAIAPILDADSIDRSVAFEASRWGKGEGTDYLNCPMSEAEYNAFLDALLAGECMPLHDFEEPKYFEGCLPVEVIAARGRDTLRFGAMKPVGIDDPRTGRFPYALVQLRKEDVDGQAYNLVGFQTKLKYPEQKRIFRMIPGLQDAVFVRLGAIHRNTYLDSPNLLDDRMRLKGHRHLRFAGQITGVEGYVESAAHGLLTGRLLAADMQNATLAAPGRDTAIGALWHHVLGTYRTAGHNHEPQNVNWAMLTPTPEGVPKRLSKRFRALRAADSLSAWAQASNTELLPSSFGPDDLPIPESRKQRRRRAQAERDTQNPA